MTINPIKFAYEVNEQFIRYQLTAFPLSDEDLAQQARKMIKSSPSPLIKGPYISLTRSYQKGKELKKLVEEGAIHPAVEGIAEYPRLLSHQEEVFKAVKNRNHCLVTTSTGSGKTEAFLYPIFDYCFQLRDQNAPEGIVAILIYPMNALAIDQLNRLRKMLAGTGISFGLYIGSTPSSEGDLSNTIRMKEGEGSDKIPEYIQKYKEHENITIAPFEERLTEQEMAENPPRILLTNVYQLEFLMTRGKDLGMFEDAPLKFLVVDEAHTYTGARGAEVSCLIRRIRTFCNKSADDIICIGTSATITDPTEGEGAATKFAHRFFGVNKDNITIVQEKYREEYWPETMILPPPVGEGSQGLFIEALRALEGEGNTESLSSVIKRLTQIETDSEIPWQEFTYNALKQTKVAKAIYEQLEEPCLLQEATEKIWKALDRISENKEDDTAELLTYLVLGAAASKDNNPLFRPKLHYFLRGFSDVSAVLHDTGTEHPMAELFFSGDKALQKHTDILPLAVYPIMVCTNCGQHYFEAFFTHIAPEKNGLNGGDAEGDNVFWPRTDDGVRVVFTNKFVIESDVEENGISSPKNFEKKWDYVYVCQFCGTFHKSPAHICSAPGCGRSGNLVKVCILKEHNRITKCPVCGHRGSRGGSRKYEPFKPLSAVQVADVHILTQDMLNAETADNKKIIVFTDNRQDAAFQAAWMENHARRYRLEHLMYKKIHESTTPISIGDLQDHLFTTLKQEKELARILAPEVFMGEIEESFSSKTDDLLKKYLRIQLVREFVTSFKRKDSLEAWGVARVCYFGLDETLPDIDELAEKYNIDKGDLLKGIESLLDVFRRGGYFFDEITPIFSQYWHPGCDEVQRGFLPYMDFPPKGLKFTRENHDKSTLVTALISKKGQTLAENFIKKWDIDEKKIDDLLEDIWVLLTKKLKLLTPVTLRSTKGRPLAGAVGVFQIDSKKIGIVPQFQSYRCNICKRKHTRDTPKSACTAYHCEGKLQEELPSEDEYTIHLLSKDFTMPMPKEHTAQVPAKMREKIEEDFRKPEKGINCLVATPTLELGVDIGDLDMILMRNVPPLPSNYWQRAGRAGRRHRMAVIYTYCRKSIHDEYFFNDPIRILAGTISPPQFNLRNPVMIRKHVHAAILSKLVSLKQFNNSKEISQSDQEKIRYVLSLAFPAYIRQFLLNEEKKYRDKPVDVAAWSTIIEDHIDILVSIVESIFKEYWPEDAENEVTSEILLRYIVEMTEKLQETINLIHRRFLWTLQMRKRLLKKKEDSLIDETEEKMLRRCDLYIKSLIQPDLNTYTLNVFSREGLLPSYGMYQGNIRAYAGNVFSTTWRRMIFELNRSPTIAVREFVSGNMLYANGGKYRVALFHLPVGEEQVNPDEYYLEIENQRVMEKGVPTTGYTDTLPVSIEGIPICDVDLKFMSHVSDEEVYRFRLPVFIAGYLRADHRGGDSYTCSDHSFDFIRGQTIRLVNAGPANRVINGELGYPICLVCGATRSPYASKRELDNFYKNHEEICGKKPDMFAITADVQVDGIVFKDFTSLNDAINLTEALRIGASQILEMDVEDLHILVLPQGAGSWDVILYDPMIGGSGLLDQLVERWKEIIDASKGALKSCPNACVKSCYSCMRTYWNIMNHGYLDRWRAVELLDEWNEKPEIAFSIPPKIVESTPSGSSTNLPETRLRKLLINVGFPPFDAQKTIPIPHKKYRSTTPDLLREDPASGIHVAIYLDGLSKDIHGNEERQKIDALIRNTLKCQGYEVIEMSVSALDDPEILKSHLKCIAHVLDRRELIDRINKIDIEKELEKMK